MQLVARGRIADRLPPDVDREPEPRELLERGRAVARLGAVGSAVGAGAGADELRAADDGGRRAARARARVARRRVGRAGRQERAGVDDRRGAWRFAAVGLGGVLLILALLIIAVAVGRTAKPAARPSCRAGPVPTVPPPRRRTPRPSGRPRGAGQDRQGGLRDRDRRADRPREEGPATGPTCTCCSSARTRAAQTGRRPGGGGPWLAADRRAPRRPEAPGRRAQRRALARRAGRRVHATRGAHGHARVDLLYDIAYGASGRHYPQAAGAREALARPRATCSPREPRAGRAARRSATRRRATQKHALLQDAGDKGDARMAGMLTPYQSSRGCGFLGRSDCYPCLHKDTALKDAIAALSGYGRPRGTAMRT